MLTLSTGYYPWWQRRWKDEFDEPICTHTIPITPHVVNIILTTSANNRIDNLMYLRSTRSSAQATKQLSVPTSWQRRFSSTTAWSPCRYWPPIPHHPVQKQSEIDWIYSCGIPLVRSVSSLWALHFTVEPIAAFLYTMWTTLRVSTLLIAGVTSSSFRHLQEIQRTSHL